jgi:hypothetical protein
MNTNTIDIYNTNTIKTNYRVYEANRIYDILHTWLHEPEMKESIEHVKNTLYNYTQRSYTLDIHATLAAFYLFYMITITHKCDICLKNNMILNTELIIELIEQSNKSPHIKLTPRQQLYSLVSSGLNLNHGFVWNVYEDNQDNEDNED